MSSKTNGEEFKEQLEDIIKCPICLDNFNKPSLCNVKCCNCNEHTAKVWCRDCLNKGFCRECYETLHKLPALADHRPGESKPPKIIHCSEHPTKEAEFWCEEDKTLYCSGCLIEKHQQHKCELIGDAVKKVIHKIKEDFTKHPLSVSPEIELKQILTEYEEQSKVKKLSIAEIFASIRRMIDDREKLINENLSDVDVQNKKKIEEYQIEWMQKWRNFREWRLLFKQRVTTADYVTILQHRDNYQLYFSTANEDWTNLRPPILSEYNVEGVSQVHAAVKQALENIRVVEQSPYQNPQLEELISNQKNNSTLNLNNHGLNDFDTIIIARALRINMKVTTLYLGNNQITAVGAARIADSLRYIKILTKLDLWSNQIGTIGAQHIADILRNNKTLMELGLNANQIDNKGAQYFADILRQNKTLAILHLADNQIGDEGAQSLVDMLKSNTTLKELYILKNKEISANVRTQLKNQDNRLR
ncbi:unnamed protein product [Adineta steineri]|uniref:B box-type domain-containing protein n=1 Tax=Adineta steineri TaxID=433720 RepID=A0A814N9J5_9BILA|nr:unnamed protein product [Adineta steineri]CAF1284793.1 unnamed protein product [Adineta steineri]